MPHDEIEKAIWIALAMHNSENAIKLDGASLESLVSKMAAELRLVVESAVEANLRENKPVNFEPKLLWEGGPIYSPFEHYTLTNRNIVILSGIFSREDETIELVRIVDITMRQNIFQRIIGVGTLKIISSDRSRPVAIFKSISRPKQLKAMILRAVNEMKTASHVQYEEISFGPGAGHNIQHESF